MPYATAFLSAFGLTKGSMILPGVEVVQVKSTHESVLQYKLYKYRIRLVVKLLENKPNLIKDLEQKFSIEKTVFSQYGNPYRCRIEDWKISDVAIDGSRLVVTAEGYATRVKA